MLAPRRRRQAEGCREDGGAGAGAELAPASAPLGTLLDERGDVYRVLCVEPAAGAGGAPQLMLRVERVGPVTPAMGAPYGLTPREAHIAVRLARRQTTAEIAGELAISPHTVRHHTERVLAKLGVRSREAVRRKLLGGVVRHRGR